MRRKELKRAAKGNLRRHYLLFVALCVIAALLGSEFAGSLSALKYSDPDAETASSNTAVPGVSNLSNLLRQMLEDSDAFSSQVQEREEALQDRQGSAVLGRSRGILALVVNKLSSGSYLVTVLTALHTVTRSRTVGLALLVILSLAGSFALWFFLQNMFRAASRRLFLEGRVYRYVSISRLTFFLQVGRWVRVCRTMFRTALYQGLWSLTVVGGVVKRYSYFLVPYLAAENPDLRPGEAITLSRRLMRGHKWECFVFELSFIGWTLLDALTLGLSGVFFSNPYRTAAFCEYYAALRQDWLRANPEDTWKLNDSWLFEAPDEETLSETYAQALEEQGYVAKLPELTGLNGFMARNFGVFLKVGPKERAYEILRDDQARLARQVSQAKGESYPTRLCALPVPEGRQAVEVLRYTRCYSIWSLLAMFFIFAFVGWAWEVGFAFLQSGEFVNRGVLHGPWLPIYGTGVGLILVLLYRFRSKPVWEFVLAIVLSGTVEYFTSFFMELSHGQKWWDYSGYFLNLHGRICAEGLLLFGVAGCAAVYLLAPMLDDLLRKAPQRALVPACLALLLIFCIDQGYSSKHPNMGKGITDVSASHEAVIPGIDLSGMSRNTVTERV